MCCCHNQLQPHDSIEGVCPKPTSFDIARFPMENFWDRERTFTAMQLAEALKALGWGLDMNPSEMAADLVAALKVVQGV